MAYWSSAGMSGICSSSDGCDGCDYTCSIVLGDCSRLGQNESTTGSWMTRISALSVDNLRISSKDLNQRWILIAASVFILSFNCPFLSAFMRFALSFCISTRERIFCLHMSSFFLFLSLNNLVLTGDAWDVLIDSFGF